MKREQQKRVIVVIQARVGSSRLPAKVLADLGGMTVLEWVVRACRSAALVDDVVVATTTEPADDALVDLAEQLGVAVVRGSEDDVLSRYVLALEEHPCDAVVRITSDCPLMDPELIDAVVGAWRGAPHFDYVSTVVTRSLPHGLDVELVTAQALREVDDIAVGHDRTHVTSGVYSQPDRFDLLGLVLSPDSLEFRVTVDTAEDLAAIRAIVDVLGTGVPRYRDVIGLLRERPDIVAINGAVTQKRIEEG